MSDVHQNECPHRIERVQRCFLITARLAARKPSRSNVTGERGPQSACLRACALASSWTSSRSSTMLANALLVLLYSMLCLWLAGGIASTGRTLTSDDVTAVRAALKEFFNFTGSGAYGLNCNAKLVTCRQGDNIGALVRLVFHDAAGEGGPNGCLDFVNTHDHRGLETVVSQLDTFYRQHSLSSIISVTDLWILAGAVAIEYASNSSGSSGSVLETLPATPGGLVLPFSYGRYDSRTCNDSGLLPSADFDWAKMKGLFVDRFKMSTAETVAIMGAHSLGRAEWSNSGFEGGWVTTQSSFSNQYYIELGTVKWNNSNNSAVWLESLPGKSPETIMLQVDVELLYKTKENSPEYCNVFSSYTSTGRTKARCPRQTESVPHVLSYADSITQFFANFTTAWEKMVTLNTSGLAWPGTPTNGSYPLGPGETAAPSSMPSPQPLPAPSAVPSTTLGSPTFRPSKSPTRTPSIKPTSASPTVALSAAPSTAPSGVPSTMPSALPTTIPTNVPTPLPSVAAGSPTFKPSTASPSINPTSAAPTIKPSAAPTTKPPTVSPSIKPTSSPSTRAPTTLRPSDPPSLHPSRDYTTTPSRKTSRPTSQPSKTSSGAATSSSDELPIATIAMYGGAALAVLIAGGALIVYFTCYHKRRRRPAQDSSTVVDVDELFARPNSRFEMASSAKFKIDNVADYRRDKRNSMTIASSSDSGKANSTNPLVLNPIRRSLGEVAAAVPTSLVAPKKPHRRRGLLYDVAGDSSGSSDEA